VGPTTWPTSPSRDATLPPLPSDSRRSHTRITRQCGGSKRCAGGTGGKISQALGKRRVVSREIRPRVKNPPCPHAHTPPALQRAASSVQCSSLHERARVRGPARRHRPPDRHARGTRVNYTQQSSLTTDTVQFALPLPPHHTPTHRPCCPRRVFAGSLYGTSGLDLRPCRTRVYTTEYIHYQRAVRSFPR